LPSDAAKPEEGAAKYRGRRVVTHIRELITTGLVIIFTNGFGLEGIAMMGSASFLIIYGAVNVAHLRLLNKTGARRSLVLTSLAGCLFFLGILTRHLARANPAALWTLVCVLAGCVAAEWAYRRFTGRSIRKRQPAGGTGVGIANDDGREERP